MAQLFNFSLLKNFRVRTKLYFLLAVALLGFVAYGVNTFTSLITYSVNGPIYNQIQQNEDLIADILPPPVFIVEAYLNAYQLLEISEHVDAVKIAELQAEASRLQQQYTIQRDLWEETLPEGAIRETLLQEATVQANNFFQVYNEEFFPVVLDGDHEMADTILHDKLEPLFLSHRDAINRVVALTRAQNLETEEIAANDIASARNTAIVLGAGSALLTAVIGLGISNSIVQQIRQINETTTQIAQGDLSRTVPIESQDEIGDLAQNFNQMTSQLKNLVETLEDQVKRRTQALSTSAEFGRFLSTILNEEQLLHQFSQRVRTLFNYSHVELYLFNQEQNSLQRVTGGEPIKAGEQSQFLLGQGYMGQVIQTNTPRLLRDVTTASEADTPYLLPGTRAVAWIPVSQGDQVLGVLNVQSKEEDVLSHTDIGFLQSITSQLAAALRNARSYGEAQNRAQQEALINRINQKIDAAQSVEGVLQTAVRELGQALLTKQTAIRLGLQPTPQTTTGGTS